MVAPVVVLAYSDHPEVILSVTTGKNYSILFRSIPFHSILQYSVLFCSMLVQYLFSIQEMVKEYCMQNYRKRAALT